MNCFHIKKICPSLKFHSNIDYSIIITKETQDHSPIFYCYFDPTEYTTAVGGDFSDTIGKCQIFHILKILMHMTYKLKRVRSVSTSLPISNNYQESLFNTKNCPFSMTEFLRVSYLGSLAYTTLCAPFHDY